MEKSGEHMLSLADLGNKLQEARESQGLSLEDIAEKIKVSVRILRLIEEGNTKGLPHAVYTRGFIVSYATVLDFDKEELLSALDIVFPSEDMDEAYPEPIMITPGRGGLSNTIKRFAVIFTLLLIVAGIAGGGWFLYGKYGENIIESIKKPFLAVSSSADNDEISTLYTDENRSDVLVSREAATTPKAETFETLNIAPIEETESLNLVENTEPEAMEISSANEEDNQTIVSELSEQEVVIRSRARCWVRSQSDDENPKEFTTTPGEDMKINFKEKLKVTLGNPAGVNLLVNGKPYTGDLKSNRPVTIEFP